MAMDFPDNPTVGDVYGPYTWDGEKWVTMSSGGGSTGGITQQEADARYVNVVGDQMTGDLSFESASTDSPAKIVGKVGGVVRWSMKIGGTDPAKLPGVESMFEIDVHNEDGSVKGPALVVDPYGNIHVPYTLAVLGNSWFAAGVRLGKDPTDNLDAVTKQYADGLVIEAGGMPDAPSDALTYGRHAATWESVFSLSRGGTVAASAGVRFAGDTQFDGQINAMGDLEVAGTARMYTDPVLPEDLAHKAYVDAAIAAGGGSGGGGGDYLPLTGGTLTGKLIGAQSAEGRADPMIAFGDGSSGIAYHETRDAIAMYSVSCVVNGIPIWTAFSDKSWGTQFWRPWRSSVIEEGMAAPAYSWAGNSNSGMYSEDGSSSVGFSVAGSEKLKLMTGSIQVAPDIHFTLGMDPADPMSAATKQYVDAQVAAGGGGGTGGVPEAPSDGKLYGRKDVAWSEIVGGGGLPDAPSNDGYYGRHNGNWQQVLSINGGGISGNLSIGGQLQVTSSVFAKVFEAWGDSLYTHGGYVGLYKTAAGLNARVYGGLNDEVRRWDVTLGNEEIETPLTNTGSNFEIASYDDLGERRIVAKFDRATGLGTVSGNPVNALGIATKQYVDSNAGGGGGASVIASDTMPVGAANNVLWWDSTRGKLFINYADADSTQFVEAVKLPPQVEPGIEEAPVDSSDIPYARRRNRWVRVPMKGHIWGLSVYASNTANPGLEGADPQLQMAEGFGVTGGEAVDKWGRFVMPDGGGWKGMGPFEEGRQGAGGLWSSSGDYVVKPDQWYRVYLIGKDNGETDLCYTLEDFWQPPTGFTAYRRIGMVKTKAAGIVGIRAFHAGGQGVNYWFDPPCDQLIANHTVGVPNNGLLLSAPDVYGAEAFGTITLECGSTPGAHLLYPSDQLFQGGPPVPLSNGGDQYWTISANTMGRATAQWNLPVYSATHPRNAGFINSQHSTTSTDVVRIFTRGWVDPRGADKDQD